jgi:hypothetical protein
MKLGDAIISLGKLIIDTIEQAAHAMDSFFQMVADAVNQVIDWLKSLFSFDDLLAAIRDSAQRKIPVCPATWTPRSCEPFAINHTGLSARPKDYSVRCGYPGLLVKAKRTHRFPAASGGASSPPIQEI